MQWSDASNPVDEHGRAMYAGIVHLSNDKRDVIASICWFYDDGPFYSHAVDPREPDVMRRIGPIRTLSAAKQTCEKICTGTGKDVSKRAGYPRRRIDE